MYVYICTCVCVCVCVCMCVCVCVCVCLYIYIYIYIDTYIYTYTHTHTHIIWQLQLLCVAHYKADAQQIHQELSYAKRGHQNGTQNKTNRHQQIFERYEHDKDAPGLTEPCTHRQHDDTSWSAVPGGVPGVNKKMVLLMWTALKCFLCNPHNPLRPRLGFPKSCVSGTASYHQGNFRFFSGNPWSSVVLPLDVELAIDEPEQEPVVYNKV